MDNKAHTILVSVIASYGSRLTSSTANCKAFLADFLADYTDERNVLVELHQLQLPKALTTFKSSSIDKKTLINFIDQLETQTKIAKHDLAWGVDAWSNAIDLEIKSRRMIRKQCFPHAVRDLHMVTIRPIETAPETVPEVPAVVIENANQAAFPRMAVMGVATLVSTFSIFQAAKSMLPSDTVEAPVAIEQQIAIKEAPAAVVAKPPLPKVVVIDSKDVDPIIGIAPTQIGQSNAVSDSLETIMNVEKMSGKHPIETAEVESDELTIEFAAAEIEPSAPEAEEEDTLHADIEAFLTQD